MAPHGWMRFHRGTLSAYRWFKPPEPWMWSMLPWTVKKIPLVFVSHCGCCCCWLPLTVNLSGQGDAEESAPAPYWPCRSPLSPIPQYIRPSICPFPRRVSTVCLFTFTEHLPPPPSVLVATETADSGRVGGCLRALAAMPHAVLSQYISASVLLLWPWYADSSGGSVTILSTTQRLFVWLL